MKVIPETPRAK